MGIRDKLLQIIDGGSINKWAEDHGLPPQTVHEWIKMDRTPRSAGFDVLIRTTGIPKEWWLHGSGPPPAQYRQKLTKPLTTGSGKSGDQDPNDREITPAVANASNFVFVPQYDVKASAGHGSIIHSEQVVDHLAFKKEWVRSELGCSEKDLALITVKGDSMEPSLSSNDLILVNTSRNQITDNAIYVLQYDGSLLVKRIQRRMNGSVIIKSDNPEYENEELDSSHAQLLNVLGVVVWYGRKT